LILCAKEIDRSKARLVNLEFDEDFSLHFHHNEDYFQKSFIPYAAMDSALKSASPIPPILRLYFDGQFTLAMSHRGILNTDNLKGRQSYKGWRATGN